jgi:hypothetical protein
MGGTNESVLEKESKAKAEDNIFLETLDMSEVIKGKKKKKKKKDRQSQTIRQHKSGTEFHWHDDENNLKAAISVADWYAMVRRLDNMEVVQHVDKTNKTLITFTPFVESGVVDVIISLEKIVVSNRFAKILDLSGK